MTKILVVGSHDEELLRKIISEPTKGSNSNAPLMGAYLEWPKEKKSMKVVLIPSHKGSQPFKKNIVEPGRNSPCHCQSGRKYKNCCLDKNYAVVRAKVIDASKENMKSEKDKRA